MVTLDGQRQRNALTAAERALDALAAADPDRARLNAAKAVELDQIGVFAGLVDAVDAAVRDLAETGVIGAAAQGMVREAVPAGPLQTVIDALGE